MAKDESNKFVLISLVCALVVIAGLLVAVAWLLSDARGASGETASSDSPAAQAIPEIELVADEVGDIKIISEGTIYRYPVTRSIPSIFTATSSAGFSRDELGAGLAAAHLYQRMAGIEEGSVEVIDSHALGEAKQRWREEVKELRDNIEADPSLAEVIAQDIGQSVVAGWDLESFTPYSSTVNLALLAAGVKLTARVELSWVDGDWRVVIPTTTGTPGLTRVVPEWPDLDVDFSEAFS